MISQGHKSTISSYLMTGSDTKRKPGWAIEKMKCPDWDNIQIEFSKNVTHLLTNLCDNGPITSSSDHTDTMSRIKLEYTKPVHPHSCTHSVQWQVNTHTVIGYSITVDLDLYYDFLLQNNNKNIHYGSTDPLSVTKLNFTFYTIGINWQVSVILGVCFVHP